MTMRPRAFAAVFDCALASASPHTLGEQRALARPVFGRASCHAVSSGPLRVACLSFGFVDTDLPDDRCRRCCQSVEPASATRLSWGGRHRGVSRDPVSAPPPAGLPLAGQPAAKPQIFGSGKNGAGQFQVELSPIVTTARS